jgi:hypothetical protein
MVPFVDLINHSSDLDRICAFVTRYKANAMHDSSGRPVAPEKAVLISPSVVVKQGEELFFQYGMHSNAFLISEYGFVLPRSGASDHGEMVLDDVLEPILVQRHPDLQELLERWGYWGYVDSCFDLAYFVGINRA